MQVYAVRLWKSTSRNNSLSFILKFRIQLQYVSIRYILYKFANYRNDPSWDRPRSLDMQISRSQLDNLRHQTLVDERNANEYRLVNVLKHMITNGRRNIYFQHAQTIPTNKTNWNGCKRSQTHTYELHNDGRQTHTNWNEFTSGPIRKYTQVDVGGCSFMCEGALNIVLSLLIINNPFISTFRFMFKYFIEYRQTAVSWLNSAIVTVNIRKITLNSI